MGVLYVVSVEEGAGKTAICAGLGRSLMNEGRKVGYLRPPEETGADGDIAFMKQALGLSDAVNAPDMLQGRDVVLVEARLGPSAAATLSQKTYGAVREMKGKAIAVEAYSGQPLKYLDAYQGFGESLLGVVLNKVPASRLKRAREAAAAQLGGAGTKLLGAIPENRTLLAITVGEVAESIRGKILNNPEKAGELVENFMLGAMIVDSGLDYFGRKDNKAAVVRQDRPDMQLAALETPTRCLVLSGSRQPPMYNVLQKAESRGIPIISTDAPAADIIASLEEALLGARLNQEKKLSRLTEIVAQNLDVKALA
ncbi:MAG TPA: DRTGG domain-containing protein [Dehalococcoidales bacterium]|nr:DRTGG domain-containing protein [Dehalococcoidales bacterium]